MINRNIKSKFAAFFISFLAIMFSGCENDSAYYEKFILEKSGINRDEDYIKYQELDKNGQLNSEGFYEMNDEEEAVPVMAEVQTGTVHVTFAQNNFMEINYYYDSELTKDVNIEDCYINPGDCIYYRTPEIFSQYANKYEFSEFRIYKFDKNGSRYIETSCNSNETSAVLKIPEDYQGTEIAVEPIGKYRNQTISLSAYYIDESGSKQNASGNWYVNDEPCYSPTVTIDPTDACNVKFVYSSKDYYIDVDETKPAIHYNNEENGELQFKEISAMDEISNYTVHLRHLIVADVNGTTEGISEIKVNSKKIDNIEQLKLKHTDTVSIDVSNGYVLSCTQFDLNAPETLAGYKRYTFNVKSASTLNIVVKKENKKGQVDEAYKFEQPKVSNGEIAVTLADSTIPYTLSNGNNIESSDNVKVTITPNNGYYITGSEVKNNAYEKTMTYSKYLKEIDKIIDKHPIEKYINVTLKSSDDIGTYKFTLDGKEVSGTIQLRKNQELELEYTITNTNYTFKNDFFHWFNSGKTSISDKLKITEEYDGKTITREDFKDLEIEKKEE